MGGVFITDSMAAIVPNHLHLQVYFPTFMDSSIYLRFLNELVHMLNKEDELTQAGEGSTKTGKTSRAALKLSHFIMGKDLDDPNSLWERPAFQYACMHDLCCYYGWCTHSLHAWHDCFVASHRF